MWTTESLTCAGDPFACGTHRGPQFYSFIGSTCRLHKQASLLILATSVTSPREYSLGMVHKNTYRRHRPAHWILPCMCSAGSSGHRWRHSHTGLCSLPCISRQTAALSPTNPSFQFFHPRCALMMMSWCLMSSDVIWHIRDKLWPMPKHGSIKSTYVRCMRV